MEPYNRFFGRAAEVGEDDIGIIIRSRKDADHIVDMMSLQKQELKQLRTVAQDKYQFIEKPFGLAGCDLGVIGQVEQIPLECSQAASHALAIAENK